jgi:phosphoglucomutase/phosphomannomutase
MGGSGPIFIGYDVRHHSRQFAEETAKVFTGNGLRVLLAKEITPTPLVSFACRHYQCSAAVMITASHNPPQYNGYKVYWSDGCQVVPPHDEGIMAEVAKIKSPSQVAMGEIGQEIGSEIDDLYLAELKRLQLLPHAAAEAVQIIYTNLHGTGIRLVPPALRSWGYSHLSLVEKQATLDGSFSFAPSPNPEEEKALYLGSEQLVQQK